MSAAIAIYDTLTNEYGIPYHWDRSDDVVFDVEVVRSKSVAAVEKRKEADSKRNKSDPGKLYFPVPVGRNSEKLPTLEEYAKEAARMRGEKPE